MFNCIRPLLRVVVELRRIANCLEYFAIADAREHGRMFITKPRKWTLQKDESELFHTDLATIQRLKAEDEELLLQRGYQALEQQDAVDE